MRIQQLVMELVRTRVGLDLESGALQISNPALVTVLSESHTMESVEVTDHSVPADSEPE